MTTALQYLVETMNEDRGMRDKHVDVELPAALLMGSPGLVARSHVQFDMEEDRMDTMRAVVLYAIGHPQRVLMVHVAVDTDSFSDDHYLFLQYVPCERQVFVVKDTVSPSGNVQSALEDPFTMVDKWTRAMTRADVETTGSLLGVASPLYKPCPNGHIEIDAVSYF